MLFGPKMHYETDYQKLTLRKLRLTLVALGMIVVFGTTGFVFIEGYRPLDGLYMTIITLSTVGFGEVRELSDQGRMFAMILIVLGVSLGAFTASVLGQMVLEGQLREIYGRKKMQNKIRKLTGHAVIAGYGRVGRHVTREYMRRKEPCVVIEMDPTALQMLAADGVYFVEGSATGDDVLRAAGIEKARTLITTLPDEAQNVYITLSSRYMNKDLKIIARADLDDGERKLIRAGANHVVSPHILGGQRMAMASLRPNVVDFMHTTTLGNGGLSIEEMLIPKGYRLAGKSLIDSQLKQDYHVTIIGIKKGDQEITITPGPQTVLDEGDVLVLVGSAADLERLGNSLD